MKAKDVLYRLLPYGIGVGSTLACLLIALSIFMWLGRPSVFILFMPAIMISAWYGGLKAGLLANILSSCFIYYFFLPPYYSLTDKSMVSVVQLLIYIGEGIVISYFIDYGHSQERITFYKKQEKEDKKKTLKLQEELVLAKQEVASRDEFLSIASHELKTPLTTVLLQIQTTLHNIQNVSLAEFSVVNLLHMLHSAQSQTMRLSKMINDLLNVSLITTKRLELELEEVDLTTLLQDIVEDFTTRFEREGCVITLDATQPILGKFDKLRIEQAIDNLLSNALKYGNKKPVHVTLKKEGNEAVLTIQDKGIGIASSDKGKIFLLFKRGVSSQDYKGLGVGLYITRQIILMHGGTIELKSESREGTTFTIRLPIKKTK